MSARDLKGVALQSLVEAIEGALLDHHAGATPLGASIIALCQERLSIDRMTARIAAELESGGK